VRFLPATLLVLAAAPAAAQDNVCRPGKDSHEAHTMAKFAVPLAFSGAGGPDDARPGSMGFGVELAYLPKVDDITATPTICRPDKTGPENTDLLFALVRPRVRVRLPGGVDLEASWVPPIRVGDAKANLFGLSLERSAALHGERLRVALRGHVTFGRVEGPVTCDDAALQDAQSPCYQGTRSNDAFRPNILGVEGKIAWSLRGRIHPYMGAGYNHLAPRFQVNFVNRFGDPDRTRVAVNLDRIVLFAGASWTAERIRVSGEIYSAPADAVTGRFMVSLSLK